MCFPFNHSARPDSQTAEFVTGRSEGFKVLRPAGKIQRTEVNEKYEYYNGRKGSTSLIRSENIIIYIRKLKPEEPES